MSICSFFFILKSTQFLSLSLYVQALYFSYTYSFVLKSYTVLQFCNISHTSKIFQISVGGHSCNPRTFCGGGTKVLGFSMSLRQALDQPRILCLNCLNDHAVLSKIFPLIYLASNLTDRFRDYQKINKCLKLCELEVRRLYNCR